LWIGIARIEEGPLQVLVDQVQHALMSPAANPAYA
jgi:hypothetical protein